MKQVYALRGFQSLFFVVLLLSATAASAQLSPLQRQYDWVVPHASPQANVSLKLGVTDISITYHRPFVNGREIWGKLVPYGQVWRAGANNATTISFSTDVTIEGQKLSAGKYALFMLPTPDEWEVIFNKRYEQWGAFTYNQSLDVLRVKVKPQPAEHQEALEYSLPLVSENTAQMVLRWEKIRVPFRVTVDAVGLAKAKANETFNWQSAFFAANYFLEGKRDLDEALKWADVALLLHESYSNFMMKARILGEMARYREAIQTAERAIQVAKAAKSPIPASVLEAAEKLIADWKKRGD